MSYSAVTGMIIETACVERANRPLCWPQQPQLAAFLAAARMCDLMAVSYSASADAMAVPASGPGRAFKTTQRRSAFILPTLLLVGAWYPANSTQAFCQYSPNVAACARLNRTQHPIGARTHQNTPYA